MGRGKLALQLDMLEPGIKHQDQGDGGPEIRMEPHLRPELLFPALLALRRDIPGQCGCEDVGAREREWQMQRRRRVEEGKLRAWDWACEHEQARFVREESCVWVRSGGGAWVERGRGRGGYWWESAVWC